MAKTTQEWACLVADLIAESGKSQRQVCREADVSRTVLRNLVGKRLKDIRVRSLERILAVLGYELDAFKIGGP